MNSKTLQKQFLIASFFILLLSFSLNQTTPLKAANSTQAYNIYWELRYSRSGGFAGKSESISIHSNGLILVKDNIRNTVKNGYIDNKQDRYDILSQLKLAKKYYSDNESDHKSNQATTKLSIDKGKCRDCETSSMSFTINNNSYTITQDLKIAGKFIYKELLSKISTLQKKVYIKQ